MSSLNKYSKVITQDPSQPASQAMLYAVGLSSEDMSKAQVGIVSTGFEGKASLYSKTIFIFGRYWS